jgi:segregation and condensation protein A
MILNEDIFSLSNFEGSLDFLLCLIQKDEIDIYDVPIQNLLNQFTQKFDAWEADHLNKGAEFIGTAAYLVWLKSKTLLPANEGQSDLMEEIEDPHFEIIHHLIDYCRFKQAAKELSDRQEKQQACYFRGIDAPEWKKPLGIDHVSLDELSQLFKEMIRRAPEAPGQIQEEQWRVGDKMSYIRRRLRESASFPLTDLIAPGQSRMGMIVTFLAILELMKIGEMAVGREQDTSALRIYSKREEHKA